MLNSHIQEATLPLRDFGRKMLNNLMLLVANAISNAAVGLATATVTSQVKFTNTVTYKFEGALKSLAATDNFWTLNGVTVPVSSFQKWLLCVDSAQAAFVVPSATGPQSTAAAVKFSMLPNGYSVFGVVQVATDGTHTFVPGTTLLGAAGITATYLEGFDSSLLELVTNA